MLINQAAYLPPPANEVWGKVIFSEACVKNSVPVGGEGGGAGMCGCWRACVVTGGACVVAGDVCAWLLGGHVWLQGACVVAGGRA